MRLFSDTPWRSPDADAVRVRRRVPHRVPNRSAAMTDEDDMLASSNAQSGGPPGSEVMRTLFHRLNNQLGIVLANAELLEARATDDATRARAAQVLDSAVQALETVRQLRGRLDREP
jgi:hypothetical protein